MTAREQLGLDGHVVEVAVPEQRHAPELEQDPIRERDRWRVSDLFVQPREHNDDERERGDR